MMVGDGSRICEDCSVDWGKKGKTREGWTRGQLEQNANGMGGYVSLESERVGA
jgi:hypothetical protein